MYLPLKGLYIKDRDIEFFSYIHSVKIATYEQIQRDIYPDYKIDSVGRRMRKIENNKLLKSYRARTLLNGRVVVSLTKRGFTAFVKDGLERRIELKSDSVNHDLDLVDIRYKLLKQNRVQKYFTENEVQTWGHVLDDFHYATLVELNSDAILDINFPRATLKVPLEYDANLKTSSRYEDLFTKYYSRDDIQIVLYICENESTMKRMIELEKKKHKTNRPKLFYALKRDILNSELSKFQNCRKDELTL